MITFLGGCSPVLWGLFMKGPDEAHPVNVAVFGAYFATLLLTSAVLFWLVRRLPEKTGPAYPLLQGGWLLRPYRGLANLISLVERPVDQAGEEHF